MQYQTLHWRGDSEGTLWMIDQTLLPGEFREIACPTVESVWDAIKVLRVRGAPAIGVAAAYGVIVGIQSCSNADRNTFDQRLQEVTAYLATSRPTAVNLFWALDRMTAVANAAPKLSAGQMLLLLFQEAVAIDQQDREMCAAIGRHGSELLATDTGVLTHCNAGGLATAGSGTALSVMFAAAEAGKTLHVFADETRPLLQGARLTAWELQQHGIQVTVICDSMAAQVMKEGRIQAVVTGADRIAANGDAANKIGTYGVAVLAKAHQIPFYVAAPSSTFDLSLSHGGLIPIEQRAATEITHSFGCQTVPDQVEVYNPAFDVTPAELITALITERGIIPAPTTANIAAHLSN